MTTTLIRLAAVLAAICLTACGGGAIPNQYLLPQPATNVAAPVSDVRVILGRVDLPAYARNAAIDTLQRDGTVTETAAHRWAAPPAQAISALLAQRLEIISGASAMVRPSPVAYRPNTRLTVKFDVFARDANGDAVLQGQFSIDQAGEPFVLERFALTKAASDNGYAAYMNATAAGLDDLAALIAARLVIEGSGANVGED
ncbi:MAG: ABC-type transport auxiliary lipoprotein family protein [Pseudomonadota bacterium]